MNPSNDPNNQTPPPQRYYLLPNQGLYPQQFNPEVQNNPNNYYAQQPQNPVLMPQKNKLDELDQGWFQCYKIYLYIVLILGIMSTINLFLILTQIKDNGFYSLSLVFEVCYLVFLFIQIQAIQERSASKSKIALSAFVLILFIELLVLILYLTDMTPGDSSTLVALSGICSFVSLICVLFGSACVFGFLEKHKPQSNNGYRNFHNVTQNNVTA